MADIAGRKADHIELCATGDVGFRRKTTLLEHVELVHDAVPELDVDDIDTSVTLFGKRLRMPLIIAAMTGGTARAREINRELARIAEERGYGFGLGSQRAMLRGESASTYAVRDVAPTTLVLGNIGGVQAAELPTAPLADLVRAIGADALCVHLNPAMELIQPGGDRRFKGVLAAIERLIRELGVPVVAKETGCGISPGAAARLARIGVAHIDVSGAGGTSWVAVETERVEPGSTARSLGEALRDWGVPTAASVAFVRAIDHPPLETIIATGGIATGVDAAKAIALGAHAAGIARPVLQALTSGGPAAARALFDAVEAEIRAIMVLVGARTVGDLRNKPKVITGDLVRWLELGRSAASGVR